MHTIRKALVKCYPCTPRLEIFPFMYMLKLFGNFKYSKVSKNKAYYFSFCFKIFSSHLTKFTWLGPGAFKKSIRKSILLRILIEKKPVKNVALKDRNICIQTVKTTFHHINIQKQMYVMQQFIFSFHVLKAFLH